MKIVPSATILRYLRSRAFTRLLRGPRGEGKTRGVLSGLLLDGQALPPAVRPLRCCVVRDTMVNLRRTVHENITELEREGLAVEWDHANGHGGEARLGGDLVHLICVGLDRMADVARFQGMNIGRLWLDDPAPAADISGGIPSEVYGVGATSLRQKGVIPSVELSMNYPDSDHWTNMLIIRLGELAEEPEFARLLAGRPPVETFDIPRGENQHVTQEQRTVWHLALKATGRHDLIDRLILGKPSQVVLGEAVMPEYNDATHVAEAPLPILRHQPILRLWDFGLTPVCIWTQIHPMGYWHILHAVQGVNQGVDELIEAQVKPWEADYLVRHDGGSRDLGDAAGRTREQSRAETSAAGVIEDIFGTTFEAGPIAWPSRRDALKGVLGRLIRGIPVVRVDPECTLVRRALRGGWHYPKNGLGIITPTIEAAKRVSGLHDHVGHAGAHGASILFPVDRRRKHLTPPPRPVERRPELAWMGS